MADDESTDTVESQKKYSWDSAREPRLAQARLRLPTRTDWDSSDEEATTDQQREEARLARLPCLPTRTDWDSSDEEAITDSAPPHQQREEPRLALPGRTDSHLLPTGIWKWGGEPGCRILVLKDGAPASFNAAQQVWPEEEGYCVENGMCMTHASMRHVSKNKKVINNEENQKKIQDDLYKYKSFPHLGLIGDLEKLMLWKWEEVYKEEDYRSLWEKSWGGEIKTRVQTNKDSVWRGGIPCDNNVIESFNNNFKQSLGQRKLPLVPFLDKLFAAVETFSKNDTSYCGRMKDKVHSQKFYKSILDLLHPDKLSKQDHKLRFSFTTLRFPFNYPQKGYPNGSFLFISERGINRLTEFLESNRRTDPRFGKKSKIDLPKWLSAQTIGGINWLRTFNEMVLAPQDVIHHGFDALVEYAGYFHLLRPINSSEDKRTGTVIELHCEILKCHGIPLAKSPAEIIAMGNKGFMSCSCELYLHYGKCKHFYAIAIERGIVSGIPRIFDTARIDTRKKPGRPINQAGRALHKDPDSDGELFLGSSRKIRQRAVKPGTSRKIRQRAVKPGTSRKIRQKAALPQSTDEEDQATDSTDGDLNRGPARKKRQQARSSDKDSSAGKGPPRKRRGKAVKPQNIF